MDIPILIGVPTFVVFLLVLAVGFAVVRLVPILLRKSLIAQANSDSVALMRFAPEAGHDWGGPTPPGAGRFFVFFFKRGWGLPPLLYHPPAPPPRQSRSLAAPP